VKNLSLMSALTSIAPRTLEAIGQADDIPEREVGALAEEAPGNCQHALAGSSDSMRDRGVCGPP
jgi:hypothetical protein